MDFSTFLESLQNSADVFTTADVLITLLLAFALALAVAWTYRATYRGVNYTQSYVHTLVIMSVVVALIMLIIGSNIARAFTLVGALSIIRFRNAVKETRDVGFIFFAMAIGMAAGTRFYQVAMLATVLICLMVVAMARLNLFAPEKQRRLLRIRLDADLRAESVLGPALKRYLRDYDLIAMETVQAGTLTELVYSVELKEAGDAQTFLNALSLLNNNNKVVLISGQQETDL